MIKRMGKAVLNSDTAYCFGGNSEEKLFRTRKSKTYFIHKVTSESEFILPITENDAIKFSSKNNISLKRKVIKRDKQLNKP